MLFVGDGVPRQRAHGLMWLTIAKNAAHGAKDQWMIDLYNKDFGSAADDDKQMAAVYVTEYGKGREGPAAPPPPLPVDVANPRAGGAPPLLPPTGMSRSPAPPAPLAADAGPPGEPPRE